DKQGQSASQKRSRRENAASSQRHPRPILAWRYARILAEMPALMRRGSCAQALGPAPPLDTSFCAFDGRAGLPRVSRPERFVYLAVRFAPSIRWRAVEKDLAEICAAARCAYASHLPAKRSTPDERGCENRGGRYKRLRRRGP